MTIKHLVLSGGGPTMLQQLGAIQYLETEAKYMERRCIETIYGTSAGGIVGVLLCLDYDWDTLCDYFIKRPWQDVFAFNLHHLLEAYSKKGIYDSVVLEKCFRPLMDAKNIPLTITLEEFYSWSKIELHLFSFEINEFTLCDISHITHPNLALLQAIQMTCAIPMLVCPVCTEDGQCHIDGGIACNYPLHQCISSGDKPLEEILGFKNNYVNALSEKNQIHETSTMIDFLLNLLFQTVFTVSNRYVQPNHLQEVICDTNCLSFQQLQEVLSNMEMRRELWKQGETNAKRFLEILS